MKSDRSDLTTLRITGRRASHFTRVVTMFAHELELPFEMKVVHDLLSLDPPNYGGHPALKVPTLHIDGSVLFGTENICRRLTTVAGRLGDPQLILTEHLKDDLTRSTQELVWHAMSVQVQLIIGVRVGKLPVDNVFFAKAKGGFVSTLEWLESHHQEAIQMLATPRQISLLEVSLFCLVEHLQFRPTVEFSPFPKLQQFAATFGARDSARRTSFGPD